MKLFIALILNIYILFGGTLLPKSKHLIEGNLSNGFKYTILKNKRPESRVEIKLYIGIGSLEEEDNESGVAHFIEHLAFNGTEHFKKNDIIKYFESIGMDFGSHLNAQTSYEDTIYSLTVPLERDNLEKSFLFLEDIASNISFDKGEFEKEKGVILEEARVRKNEVAYRLFKKSKPVIFGNSRYLNRDPIGKEGIIKNITVDEVKSFYNRWYRPEFMHLFVVGDINETQIKELILKHFSHLKNSSKAKRYPRYIAENNKTRVLSISDKELSYNYLNLLYLDKLENLRTIEDLNKSIVEEMAIALFNLRAKEQLLKNNPKASMIYLSSDAINKNRGKYTFLANFKESKDAKLALEELYRLIFSFREYGFSKDDFLAIKQDLLLNNENELKEYKNIYSNTIISWLVEYAKSNSIYVEKSDEYNITKNLINSIELKNVNEMFKKITDFKDRAVIFATTNSNLTISKSDIKEIEREAKENIQNYAIEDNLPKELFDSSTLESKKIENIEFLKDISTYRFRLENGMEIYFKKSKLSNNRVVVNGFSLGGHSLYPAKLISNAIYAPIFIGSSGLGRFSNIQLSKILSNKDVYVSLAIKEYIETIYGESSSTDIETLFKFIYLHIKEPVIDKRVERNLKNILKAKVKEKNRDPFNRFVEEVNIWYSNNNPRVIEKIDTIESINRLDREKMLKIYRDRFCDFNNFKFIIIGDINLSTAKKLSSKYLGNLPTKDRNETYIDRKIDYKSGKVYFYRYYNNEDITRVYIVYRSNLYKFNKRDFYILDALVNTLNIRLRNLIREDKSGVYDILVTKMTNLFSKEKENLITINFSCNPKRANELIDSVYNQIEKIKKEEILDSELKVFKKQWHNSYNISIKKNGFWLNNMANSILFNKSLNLILSIPNIIDSITKRDIKDMANIVFGKNILEARLNPKKDKK